MDRIDGKTVFDLIGLGGSFVPPEEEDEEEAEKTSELVKVSRSGGDDEMPTQRAV
jgi:hypothetical protein